MYYHTAIHLPDDAEIVNVTAVAYDDANDFEFALLRGLNYAQYEFVTELADSGSLSGSGEVVSPASATPNLPRINNQDYCCCLYLKLPAAASGDLLVMRFKVKALIEPSSPFRMLLIE